MKAIVYSKFGPPEVLEYTDVEKPSPQPNQVLVKIIAGTVTKEEPDFRSSPGFNGLFKPRNPILGEEFSGIIEAVGDKVTRFKPDDPILGIDSYGAHAEYKCIAEDKTLMLKPANLGYPEAAAFPNGFLTALPFLRDKGGIQAGQKVLINGASGSVGTAAVQLSRHFGAEVTGVCNNANLELVRSLGADHVIDYTAEDFTQNGKKYDIIFDAVGKRSFSECKDSLTPTGIYLTTVPGLDILLGSFRRKGKRAGFLAAGLRSPEKKITDLNFLIPLAEAGMLKPVIDRIYPLEDLAEAHKYVKSGRKRGNVVIKVTE